MSNHVTTLTTKTPELKRIVAKLIRKYPGYSPHRVRNRALALGLRALDSNPKLLLEPDSKQAV